MNNQDYEQLVAKLNKKIKSQEEELNEKNEILFSQNSQFASIHNIGLNLMNAAHPIHLCRIMTEALCKELGAKRAAIFLIDESSPELVGISESGGLQEIDTMQFPFDRYKEIKKSIETGRVVNYRYYSDNLQIGPNIFKHWAIFPVKSREHILGLMIAEIEDLDMSDSIAILCNHVGMGLNNLKMMRELKDLNELLKGLNQELQEDLEIAAEVQSATMNLKKEYPFIKSALLFHPYSKVSGDFYDLIQTENNKLMNFFLGDATGHGVSAALITMMVKMGLNSLSTEITTDEIMRKLNRMLNSCLPTGKFVTGIYFRINSDGLLTMSNAGHLPLLIIPAEEKETVIIKQGGMALGMIKEEIVPYKEHSYQLKPGDKIFVYTDGITDCYSDDKEFGLDKLILFLEKNKYMEIDTILTNLFNNLTNFTKKFGFHDDLTMIGFQYL